MAGNIYLISDIHGCLNTFNALLKKIKFDSEDLLICLGDVIDRGKYGLELLNIFMDNPNMILIKGNHEYFMELFLKGELNFRDWNNFDGGPTLSALYTEMQENELAAAKYLSFLKSLPLYYQIDKYTLSHSGLSKMVKPIYTNDGKIDVVRTIEEQYDLNAFIFMCSFDLHKLDLLTKNRKVLNTHWIVGHKPTSLIRSGKKIQTERPFQMNTIYHEPQYTGIDCGCGNSKGKLGVLRLNDMKEFYRNVIKEDLPKY